MMRIVELSINDSEARPATPADRDAGPLDRSGPDGARPDSRTPSAIANQARASMEPRGPDPCSSPVHASDRRSAAAKLTAIEPEALQRITGAAEDPDGDAKPAVRLGEGVATTVGALGDGAV